MFLSFVLRQLGDRDLGERVKAARTLARAMVENALGEEERAVVEKSLLLATRDASPEVRLALAEVLAPAGNAPRQLIHFLARDADHIAALIVSKSPLLSDAELIMLAETADEPVTMAIAARPEISPNLAGALVAHCGAPTALRLLQNPGAAILKEDVFLIAKKHGDDPTLRDYLMSREDLPIVLRHRLLLCAINGLQDSPLLKTTMSPKKMEAMLFEAFEKAAIALMRGANDEELAEYIMILRSEGLLTPQFFVRAVCQGQVRFLNEVLAQLTRQKPRRVYHIISRGSVSALTSLLKQSGLPSECQLVTHLAIELLRSLGSIRVDEPATFARILSEHLLKAYEANNPATADRLLAILRGLAAEAAMDELKASAFPFRRHITAAA